jgi:hypothetical protein
MQANLQKQISVDKDEITTFGAMQHIFAARENRVEIAISVSSQHDSDLLTQQVFAVSVDPHMHFSGYAVVSGVVVAATSQFEQYADVVAFGPQSFTWLEYHSGGSIIGISRRREGVAALAKLIRDVTISIDTSYSPLPFDPDDFPLR